MEINNIKNAFIGDGTGKIKTFAVITTENPVEDYSAEDRRRRYRDPLRSSMVFLSNTIISRDDNTRTLLIYGNPACDDILNIASKFAVKSFFFATNEFPATITYYKSDYELKDGENTIPKNTYEKAETLINITSNEDAEKFFLRTGNIEIDFNSKWIKRSAMTYCNNTVKNVNYPYYVEKATDETLIAECRKVARRILRMNGVPGDYSVPALLGDGKGKIKNFAVLITRSEDKIFYRRSGIGRRFSRLDMCFTDGGNIRVCVMCNLTPEDALYFASGFAQKSVFFVNNELPASITYYKSEYEIIDEKIEEELVVPVDTYKQIDVSENITELNNISAFILCHTGLEISAECLTESVDYMCMSIINEEYPRYVAEAVDEDRLPIGRSLSRHHLRTEEFYELRRHFENVSAPALLGDGKGKIKTFAVMTDINPADLAANPNGFRWYLRNLGLRGTNIENNNGTSTFILYNISYKDVENLATRFAQKSFFFADNEYPVTLAYYEDESGKAYRKTDVLENITAPEPAEEFILRHSGCDIKFKEEMILENSGIYCDSIINENYAYYISRAVDDSLIPRARAMARHNARRMEKPIKEI